MENTGIFQLEKNSYLNYIWTTAHLRESQFICIIIGNECTRNVENIEIIKKRIENVAEKN